MIRYTLKCDHDHSFESWFQSADAFDKLQSAGMVACTACGSTKVSKSLMAPSVRTETATEKPALTAPATPQEEALTKLRKHVEANSEYVGMKFADEARKMHDGDTPERPIYGEAKPQDAIKLIEDGVPVLPLPFAPRKQTN
ncbi:DUF1178 family protein [Marivivens donghaensis]|uniref:DUF1178 family protein n=1 Tax=Marivivens donghaensis TaxID=1699413 RepID=A0ABX0VVF4_9RHOB|nr:DUF1178 family protein [Marivivens donghaensis]NIY72020.1 DUF1178 family protein [Marivivens donghaensis]